MNTNKYLSWTLRIGLAVGLIAIVIGEMVGGPILYYGILALIVTPFVGVFVTLACFVAEKDWYWSAIAVIMVAVICVGLVLAM